MYLRLTRRTTREEVEAKGPREADIELHAVHEIGSTSSDSHGFGIFACHKIIDSYWLKGTELYENIENTEPGAWCQANACKGS